MTSLSYCTLWRKADLNLEVGLNGYWKDFDRIVRKRSDTNSMSYVEKRGNERKKLKGS